MCSAASTPCPTQPPPSPADLLAEIGTLLASELVQIVAGVSTVISGVGSCAKAITTISI